MPERKILAPNWWGLGEEGWKGLNPEQALSIAAELKFSNWWKRKKLDQGIKDQLSGERRVKEEVIAHGIPLISLVENEKIPDDFPGYVVIGRNISQQEQMDILQQEIPDLNIPRIVTYEEFEQHPFFPVVVKNTHSNRGEDKFLLTSSLQWKRLQYFLQKGAILGKLPRPEVAKIKTKILGVNPHEKNTAEYVSAFKAYKQTVNGMLNPILDQPLGEKFFDNFQEFISTPGDRFTTYRVLVSCVGEILAAGLLYSPYSKTEPRMIKEKLGRKIRGARKFLPGPKVDLLKYPEANVYLGLTDFRSNMAQNGGNIVINPGSSSRSSTQVEKHILADHSLDPNKPLLPSVISERSSQIGRILGPSLGLLLGLDFIQKDDGTFYFLETNVFPGLQTYINARMNGQAKPGEAYFRIHQEILSKL